MLHDQSGYLGRVSQRSHVSGAGDGYEVALIQHLRQIFGDQAAGYPGLLAAKEQNRKPQILIPGRLIGLADEGMEIERRLGRPAHQGRLHARPQCVPRARSVPVVDEVGRGSAHVAVQDAFIHAADQIVYFGAAFRSDHAHACQQMECRGFVEGQAGDPMRPGECRMQSHGAAIGMAHEVHLGFGLVDQGKRARRLVGQGKGALTAPVPRAIASVVLGREQLPAAAQGL